MLKLFISYRRDDAGGYSRLVGAELGKIWGDENVFLDVDGQSLPPGVDYDETVIRTIQGCDVVLALIGRRWADAMNLPRLAEPRDLVRREVLTAREHQILLIPVLVGEASMPPAGVLPEELQWLERIQAHEISDTRWDYDLGRLVQTLRSLEAAREVDRVVVPAAQAAPGINRVATGTAPAGARRSLGLRQWVGAAASVAVLVTAGALIFNPQERAKKPIDHPQDSLLIEPTVATTDSSTAGGRPTTCGRGGPAWFARRTGASLKIDRAGFFRRYAETYGSITPQQRSGLNTLLYYIERDKDMADVRWAAYLLATAKHHTLDQWIPIEEPGKGQGRIYGNSVTVRDSAGRQYTHVYYGRGYIDLTWDYNYRNVGRALGIPLLYEPDLALEPQISYNILSFALRNGTITGAELASYISRTSCDYVKARRTINGLDQAEKIAADAAALERILRETSTVSPGA
jgi:hypothetical protein